MAYNSRYYHTNQLHQLRPRTAAFATYSTPDNIAIGIFQGSRGANPALDFKVRILLDGINNTPILPPHIYWVADLMLKCVNHASDIKKIVKYYLKFYDLCVPFTNPTQRNNYQLRTLDHIRRHFGHIQHQNTLSLDYVVIVIELFCLNEKQTPGAHMFRDLLGKIFNYANGTATYLEVLIAAQAGYR